MTVSQSFSTCRHFNWLRGEKKLHRQGTLHRARHINYHINTCTQVLLHIIHLTEWHVRQPFGPTSSSASCRPARPWLQLLASTCCCCFHAVKEEQCWDEVTFVRQLSPNPLSSSEYIILIYDRKSLSSIFWWPTHIKQWHTDLFTLKTLNKWLCILMRCCWYLHLVQWITHHPHTEVYSWDQDYSETCFILMNHLRASAHMQIPWFTSESLFKNQCCRLDIANNHMCILSMTAVHLDLVIVVSMAILQGLLAEQSSYLSDIFWPLSDAHTSYFNSAVCVCSAGNTVKRTQSRKRLIIQLPSNGGQECPEVLEEERDCEVLKVCPGFR